MSYHYEAQWEREMVSLPHLPVVRHFFGDREDAERFHAKMGSPWPVTTTNGLDGPVIFYVDRPGQQVKHTGPHAASADCVRACVNTPPGCLDGSDPCGHPECEACGS